MLGTTHPATPCATRPRPVSPITVVEKDDQRSLSSAHEESMWPSMSSHQWCLCLTWKRAGKMGLPWVFAGSIGGGGIGVSGGAVRKLRRLWQCHVTSRLTHSNGLLHASLLNRKMQKTNNGY